MGLALSAEWFRFITSAGIEVASLKCNQETFTNAEVKASPTVPLVLADAPARTGKYIWPVLIELRLNATSGIYTGIDPACSAWAGADLGTSPTTVAQQTSKLANIAGISETGFSVVFATASINGAVLTPHLRPDATNYDLAIGIAAINALYNKPLTLFVDNGPDFTGGHASNSMTVTSLYLEL